VHGGRTEGMSFKKRAIVHMVLGLTASIGFFAAAVVVVLKLAEIGMGPSLSWGVVGVALGVAFTATIGLVLNMFRAMNDD
jgi:hypothetical protein